MATLLPLVIVGAWQGLIAWRDSAELLANRLRANVWAMADPGGLPFVVARQSLAMASQHPAVRIASADCSRTLARMTAETTGVVNLARTDRTGLVVCSGLKFDPRQRFDQLQWWQTARSSGQVVIGPPQIGEISRRLVVVMGMPLYDAEGRFDGTISAGIDLQGLDAKLRDSLVNTDSVVMIVSRQGDTIISAGETEDLKIADPRSAIVAPATARDREGGSWLYVTAPLYGNLVYLAYAERRTSFISRTVWRTSLVLALPLLAAALAAAAVWFAAQRQLLVWFPRLEQLAARIATGEFTADDPRFASAPREIHQLKTELRRMATALECHEQDLRSAIEAKFALTREVNHRVRNNLQLVISMLTLQGSHARNRWERDIVGQLRSRLGAIASTQRMAYEMERGNEGEVNGGAILCQICDQVRGAFKDRDEVALTCVCADVPMHIDQAMPLMLFVVEVTSNILTDGFRGGQQGFIRVTLIAPTDVLTQVPANGQAGSRRVIRLVIEHDARVVPGIANPDSLPFQLAEGFAQQLDGKVTAERKSGQVTVELAFPER